MKAIPVESLINALERVGVRLTPEDRANFESLAIPCNDVDPPGHGHHGDLDKLLKRIDSWRSREPSSTPYAQGYRDALADLTANIREAIDAQNRGQK